MCSRLLRRIERLTGFWTVGPLLSITQFQVSMSVLTALLSSTMLMVVLHAELLDLGLLMPSLTSFADEAAKLGLQINWRKTVLQFLSDFVDCPN